MLRSLPLILAAALFAGCSASAPATRSADGFSNADLDRVAVVFAESRIGTKGVTSMEADPAATARARAELPRLMRAYAPHFGVTLVDARQVEGMDSTLRDASLRAFMEAVQDVREQNQAIGDLPFAEGKQAGRQPLDNAVAEDITALADHTGCRYLLSVGVQGWGATGTEKFLDALAIAAGGLAGAVAAGAGGPSEIAAVETVLIDAERGEVVWYSTRGGALDPRNPEHLEALLQTVAIELFSGQYISPFSLSVKLDHDAVVYLVDGSRLTGRVRGPDNLYFTVDTRDGEQRVPVEQVKSVRSFTDSGRLFPRMK